MNAGPSPYDDYAALIQHLPELVDQSRLTVGGFSTCVDVYLSLRDAVDRFGDRDDIPLQAQGLISELCRRAGAGIGGELFVDWPDGVGWIDAHLTGRRAIGGTSAQAAFMLSLLGAPALIALEDRSEAQLGVLHPNTLVASHAGMNPVSSVSPSGQGRAPHYIFEFTIGDDIGGVRIPRSSRVIVRFGHDPLHRDAEFVSISTVCAKNVGAGVICGFNEIEPERSDDELAYAAAVAAGWRKAGVSIVHLELGAFHDNRLRDLAIERLTPTITSLGMSLSELDDLAGGPEAPEERALRLAETHGLARVCVHADEWAFAVTLGDPARERRALQMGCLLASARAAGGYFTKPERLPDDARFSPPPIADARPSDGYSIVSCPSPFLEKPAATIGLGDTFLAGTLLVLGGSRSTEGSDTVRPATAAGSS